MQDGISRIIGTRFDRLRNTLPLSTESPPPVLVIPTIGQRAGHEAQESAGIPSLFSRARTASTPSKRKPKLTTALTAPSPATPAHTPRIRRVRAHAHGAYELRGLPSCQPGLPPRECGPRSSAWASLTSSSSPPSHLTYAARRRVPRARLVLLAPTGRYDSQEGKRWRQYQYGRTHELGCCSSAILVPLASSFRSSPFSLVPFFKFGSHSPAGPTNSHLDAAWTSVPLSVSETSILPASTYSHSSSLSKYEPPKYNHPRPEIGRRTLYHSSLSLRRARPARPSLACGTQAQPLSLYPTLCALRLLSCGIRNLRSRAVNMLFLATMPHPLVPYIFESFFSTSQVRSSFERARALGTCVSLFHTAMCIGEHPLCFRFFGYHSSSLLDGAMTFWHGAASFFGAAYDIFFPLFLLWLPVFPRSRPSS
ncbi:hypothetical protein C8R44DRAFT_885984 [Mycena epipterygia]|nr:hypothetical protein C8R44DRAFT_885984 [Mycena epipterygia]